MLGWFRKKQRTIFYAIVIPIALTMGLSYTVMSVLQGGRDEPYFVVDGEEVLFRSMQFQNQSLGSAYRYLNNSMLFPRYQQPTISELIDRQVLLREAERAGIQISDAEVSERVKDFYSGYMAIERIRPLVQGMELAELQQTLPRMFEERKKQEVFDRQQYERILGGKAELIDFERILREEIKIEKLRELVQRGARPDPAKVYERYRRENETRAVDILVLEAKDFVREVDFVLQDTAEEYYERHQDEYVEPARVGVEYVFLPHEGLEVEEPTDEEIQLEYDQHMADHLDDEGKQKPLEEVRDEVAESLRAAKREAKAFGLLETVRKRVEGGEDLAAVAKEEAGVEPKRTETLEREAFVEIDEIGLDAVFRQALRGGAGQLGEVGTRIDEGAYLYRTIEASASRPLTYDEVAERVQGDVDELTQEELVRYFERNEDRYGSARRWNVQWLRGPAGDAAADTRKKLNEITEALQAKRRKGEAYELKDSAEGDIEYFETPGAVPVAELSALSDIAEEEIDSHLEGIKKEISNFAYTRQDHIYLFRVVEKIEEEVTFDTVREQVEKDAAADTERAVRRFYEKDPERFRTPTRIDAEYLLVDTAKLGPAVEEPTEEEIAAYYGDQDNLEGFAYPEGEEDPETGSRYRPLEEVRGEIADALRRAKARRRAADLLARLAGEAGDATMADLAAGATEEEQGWLVAGSVKSLDAEEARDHADLASGALSIDLDGLPAEELQGPIQGDRGPFLLRITARTESAIPSFGDARAEVEKAMIADRDEGVRRLFDENPAKYREQDRYEIEYLIARYDGFLDRVEEPTDEEIQDHYDRNKASFLRENAVDLPADEKFKTLEEVRDEIVEAIRKEDAVRLATENIDKAYQEMQADEEKGDPTDFKLYAVVHDLEHVTESLERTDLFYHDDLKSGVASSLPREEEGYVSTVQENSYKEAKFIVRLVEKITADSPELADAFSDVAKEYYLGQADKIVLETLEVVRERVREGPSSLREVAEADGRTLLPVSDLQKDVRYLQGLSFPSLLVRRVFDLDEGESTTDVVDDTRIRHRAMIAQVTDRRDPSPDGFADEKERLVTQMEREAQEDLERSWEHDLFLRARAVPPEKVQETYEKHFRRRVKLRRIQVDVYEPTLELVEREVRRKAEEIYVRHLSGESFAALARLYSADDGSSGRGGRLFPLNRINLAAAWGEASARAVGLTSIGEVTRPVEEEDGYHLFLVEGRDGEDYRLRHIWVELNAGSLTAAMRDEAKDVARGIAEELRARILGGESFAALAVAESHGNEASRGGDMGEIGYESRDLHPEELVDAALAAEVGVVSEVIEEPTAFHIIKVYQRRDVPLDEVRHEVVAQTLEEAVYEQVRPGAEEEEEETAGPGEPEPGEGEATPPAENG